tara:strand:- start:448 stop:1416 length:969 start_codon:yes stop_codon:yes gene_type:complete
MSFISKHHATLAVSEDYIKSKYLGDIKYSKFEWQLRLDRDIQLETVGDNIIEKFLPMCYKAEQFSFLKLRVEQLFQETRGLDEEEDTLTAYNRHQGFQGFVLTKWNTIIDNALWVRIIKGRRICEEVRTKVSNKSWIKVKPVKPVKTNPTPIEFPQDVFNVIKDYMDIVDVPTPVWNEMMSKSIKEISTHRKYQGTGPDYYIPFPEGTNLRKIKVAEKRQRYFVGIIKQAKTRAVHYYAHMKYLGTYNEEGRTFYGRHWIKACECNGPKWSRCHGPVRAYVGWEATNYTMIVNQEISDLVGNTYCLGISSMKQEKTNVCVCV